MKNVLFFTGFQLLFVVGVFLFPQLAWGGAEDKVVEYLLKFWGFAIYPLWFFSLTVAVCGLRRRGRLGRMTLRIFGLVVLFYLAALLLANVVEVLFPLGKLPFLRVEVAEPQLPFSWELLLDNVLAPTQFLPLRDGTGFLLILTFLAILFGVVLSRDREVSAPTYNLCDSLSRLAYYANGVLVGLLPLPLSVITLFQVRKMGGIPFVTYRMPLLLLLLTTLLLFALLPLLARLLKKGARPYRHLLYNIRPFVVALVSGENVLVLSSLLHDQHERSGFSRNHNGWSTPLLFLFGRMGSAVMLVLAFSIVYASQNRWPMAVTEILYWRLALPLLFAVLLGFNNFGGIGVMLVLLFNTYGEGLSYGYALLLPLLPIIQRLAVMTDVLGIVVINHLVSNVDD